MATVVLVFPPLVERSFGQIYPSTAVLAAYLESKGVRHTQVDLNGRFLDHLLSAEELDASANGRYQRSKPSTCAAASWTRRALQEGLLTTPELVATHGPGRGPLDNVLRLLVMPYSVDPNETVLDGISDDPRLVDSYVRFFSTHAGALIDADNSTLLGISVPMGPQLLPALILASVVRTMSAGHDVRIVLGGPALSLLGERELTRLLRKNPSVDCIVRYDGEEPLAMLTQQLADGEWAPHTVPGTSSLAHEVVTHQAPVAGPALNALPPPLYPARMILDAPGTALGVTQARGCYWGKCDYCDFVEVYKGSPRVRARRPELVVEDIRRLVAETGVRRYRVITDSIPPAFARRFATLLLDQQLAVQWSSFAMVDPRFDTSLLRLMAGSGCEFLVIGLESMVTRALKIVHKAADRDQNVRFLSDAHAAGIRLSINLIPNLPTTTRSEAMQGLEDLEALAGCVDKVSIFDFEATRSSRVGQSPAAFGLEALDHFDRAGQAQLTLNTLPVRDPAMSAAERAEVFSAYRAFATQVNTRALANGVPDQRSYVEALDSPEGPIVVNLATLEVMRFPPRLLYE